jgi:GT2 family glycosyltransferase
MNIELSVIIVNYNGSKFLENCLNSLHSKLSGISFEIIIIDNQSTDDSCAFIKKNYPNVILIESKINYGFGKGNNEAVKHAKGEHLLLINNDTIVLNNLEPVLEIVKTDSSIGVAGINMLNANKEYIPAAGNFPNVKNMFRLIKLLDISFEFKTGIFSKTQYKVDWLAGSFWIIPRKIYQEINGFDEDYFMYVEDVDFCKRVADKGYKRVFLPQYSYIHFVGFSNAKKPLLISGYKIYISKHLKGFNRIICLAALAINKLVKKIKKSIKLD